MQPHEEFVGQMSVGTALGTTSHNNYLAGGTAGGTALADGWETPRPDGRVVHKLARRFGMRREESAPRMVVAPAAGGRALTAVEAQPGLHVCFGNPHALLPAVLREDDEIRHKGSIA